jgi:hypothetical protein
MARLYSPVRAGASAPANLYMYLFAIALFAVALFAVALFAEARLSRCVSLCLSTRLYIYIYIFCTCARVCSCVRRRVCACSRARSCARACSCSPSPVGASWRASSFCLRAFVCARAYVLHIPCRSWPAGVLVLVLVALLGQLCRKRSPLERFSSRGAGPF